MSVAYASTLLQRGMGAQDAAILSGCRPDLVRAMRSRRQEYSYYPRGALYGPSAPTRRQQIDATINVISMRHDLTVANIMGDSIKRRLAWPRQEVMYALREKFGLSYPRIGEILGRDHSTVIYGCRRHKARLAAGGRV